GCNGDCSSHAHSWGDYLDLVRPVDRHECPSKKTDHTRTVCFREAPLIYQCGFACAALDWFPLEHLVRSGDWHHPLHWIETFFASRRSTLVKDVWSHLGCLPQAGQNTVALKMAWLASPASNKLIGGRE